MLEGHHHPTGHDRIWTGRETVVNPYSKLRRRGGGFAGRPEDCTGRARAFRITRRRWIQSRASAGQSYHRLQTRRRCGDVGRTGRAIALEIMVWVYVVWWLGSCRAGNCCPTRRAWICRAWRPFRVRCGRRPGPGGAEARGSPVRARCGCAADPRSWSRPIPDATSSRSPNGRAPRAGTAAGGSSVPMMWRRVPIARSGPSPAHGDHLSDGRRPRPAMPPLESVDVVGNADGAGPDAPVAAAKVLMAQAVPILRRVVRIRPHIFIRRPRLPFSAGTWSSPPQ